jgi:DNA-directed RNA polymerase subunit RPC12/RpoP
MADIFFKCEDCGQPLVVDDAGAGLAINCPDCKADIVIPLQSELPPQQSTQPSQSPALKECPSCGNNIPAAAVICVYCGQKVNKAGRG